MRQSIAPGHDDVPIPTLWLGKPGSVQHARANAHHPRRSCLRDAPGCPESHCHTACGTPIPTLTRIPHPHPQVRTQIPSPTPGPEVAPDSSSCWCSAKHSSSTCCSGANFEGPPLACPAGPPTSAASRCCSSQIERRSFSAAAEASTRTCAAGSRQAGTRAGRRAGKAGKAGKQGGRQGGCPCPYPMSGNHGHHHTASYCWPPA